ncbi:MAG: winged helix-turn-helix domain-containing protein [Candidatus Methylarchaceae archaeon HK02M1]|nr:winged helix-turn-helix domain-containing protein [Candidatus Methylarchaceae archaeon HK01M]MCP8311804.1 winged helix-turn-helix domain-containing protein [Candidatus Methylarchaceae archaeon HK02M1]
MPGKRIKLFKQEVSILYSLFYRGGRAKMSRLMADTNMCTAMFYNYADLLVEKGFVEKGQLKTTKAKNDELLFAEYRLTPKGKRKIKRMIKRHSPELIFAIMNQE